MKNKKSILTMIILLLTICIIIMPQIVNAAAMEITPDKLKGSDLSSDIKNEINDKTDKIEKMVKMIGTFASVGGLMVIGIKYMTGSLEEKAEYKKSLQPFIIGCIFIFGAANLAPEIMKIFKNQDSGEDIANTVLGFIQVLGTIVSVGVIMLLGIKYMMGTTDERASYKRTMLPYVIGAILLFTSVTVAGYIAEMAENITTVPGQGSGGIDSQG